MTTRKTAGTECSSSKIQKLESVKGDEPSSYNKPVLECVLDVLTHGRFSDVTFIVGERKERVPCHQFFLRARSPVFEVMFSERWNQDTAKEVTLEDVEPETFRKFLQFIYTDTMEANVPEVLELHQLAHKYDVQLLVSKCEELMQSQVTLDNSIPVFQTARQYDKIQLMDKVGEIWAESLTKLQNLPNFTQLDKETLMYILKRKDLKIKEVDLFRLTLQWAGNQAGVTVEESLEDILPLIRFPLMTLNEFTTAVVPTKLLPPSTVIELFTYFGNDENARKSLAPALGFSTQERKPISQIVYTPLYSQYPEDIANLSATRWRFRFQNLKECVQFYSKKSRLRRHADPPIPTLLGFGLSGISVHCPVPVATTGPLVSFKAFNISLKAKSNCDSDYNLYFNESYEVLLSLPSFQVKEGQITDIDLGTVVPLKKETIYSITIQESASADGVAHVGGDYYANDFGSQKDTIVVNVINNGCTTLNLRRNQLWGFLKDDSGNMPPNLICRLGFRAL